MDQTSTISERRVRNLRRRWCIEEASFAAVWLRLLKATPGKSAVAIWLTLLSVSPAVGWVRYGSDRYGTSAEVPDQYIAQPPPENGDGRELVSPDGRSRILVFGTQDALKKGFEAPVGVRVTYRAGGAGWAVYSGRRGSKIIYERLLTACNQSWLMHHLRLEYEAVDAARMAPVVAHVSRSFHGSCTK